jgi:hypothetical protein
MLVGDLRKSLPNVYTPRGSGDPVLAASARLLGYGKPDADSIVPHTLCSITSFFATFSKYPSHILLNRSRISFSISSSCSVSAPSGGNAVSAASLVLEESRLESVLAGICFEVAGGMTPRKSRAYGLRKVVRRGKDDREGSLDSCRKLDQLWRKSIAKVAY